MARGASPYPGAEATKETQTAQAARCCLRSERNSMTQDPDWHYWIGGILALPIAALFIALIGACLDGWLLGGL